MNFEKDKINLKFQFHQAIDRKEYQLVDKYTNLYRKLFETFSQQVNKFKVEELSLNYPDTGWYTSEFKVISGIQMDIYEGFKKSIDIKDEYIQEKIIDLVYGILMLGIQKRSLIIFNDFKYTYVLFYRYAIENEQIKRNSIGLIIQKFMRIISYGLDYEFKYNDVLNKDKLRTFYDKIYFALNDLFYNMINRKDFTNFKRAMELFGRNRFTISTYIRELENEKYSLELQEKSESNSGTEKLIEIKEKLIELKTLFKYDIYTYFALLSWLLYKYEISEINKDELTDFKSHFKVPKVDVIDIFAMVVEFAKSDIRDFNWEEWGNEKYRDSGQAYTPLSASTWLIQGLVLFIIEKKLIYIGLENKLDGLEDLYYAAHIVKQICSKIQYKSEKWMNVLNIANKEEFDDRLGKVVKLFEIFKVRYEINLLESQVNQPLDIGLVNDFKKEIYNSWYESNVIHKLFEHYKIVREIKNGKVEGIGYEQTGIHSKMMFVKYNYQKIYMMEEFGHQISILEKETLMDNLVSLQQASIVEVYNIKELFDFYESKIKKSFHTNLIFSNLGAELFDSDLIVSGNLIPNWKIKEQERLPGLTALYGDVPIIEMYSNLHEDVIIFCEIEKVVEMEIQKSEMWEGRVLEIIIKELTETEIEKEEKRVKELNYSEKWMQYSNGERLNDKDLKTTLRSTIYLGVFEHFRYNIKDKSKYTVVKLIHNN